MGNESFQTNEQEIPPPSVFGFIIPCNKRVFEW